MGLAAVCSPGQAPTMFPLPGFTQSPSHKPRAAPDLQAVFHRVLNLQHHHFTDTFCLQKWKMHCWDL